MKAGVWLILIALLSFATADCVAQSTAPYRGTWTVTLENDVFTGSDSNYTNGLGVTWVSNAIDTYEERSFIRRWGEFWSFLPFVGNPGYRTYVSWSLAQEMYTPHDITVANPPLDDQPYAGVLYLDSVVYARKERWTHAWQLRVGVVGPSSRAESTQRWVHQVVGSDKPMGWDTQLPNEFVFNVGYMGTYLLAQGNLGRSAQWRVAPVASAALGNYFTGAGLGLYGEIGWNLVAAAGGTALRQGFNAASTVGAGPVDRWSVSLSGGVMGYGVVRYLPLDGTMFKDSRTVDSKPFVGVATIGIAVRYRGFVGFLGRTYFTKTFDTERQPQVDFGTLSLSWYY
ncbi:MAG TPA: lipid A deacylase LpxR family protein [Burkholderiaceae bacterium]|nr:lipid A deacylase LpxR family protein [Burkholderiaceae bacterium]